MPDRVVEGEPRPEEEHHARGVEEPARQHEREDLRRQAGDNILAHDDAGPAHAEAEGDGQQLEPVRREDLEPGAHRRRAPEPGEERPGLGAGEHGEWRVSPRDLEEDRRVVHAPEETGPDAAMGDVVDGRAAEHREQRHAVDDGGQNDVRIAVPEDRQRHEERDRHEGHPDSQNVHHRVRYPLRPRVDGALAPRAPHAYPAPTVVCARRSLPRGGRWQGRRHGGVTRRGPALAPLGVARLTRST
jgi:hypothetical protein